MPTESRRGRTRRLRPASFLLIGVLAGHVLPAQALDYKIYSPNIVAGENELEARSDYSFDHSGAQHDGEQADRVAVGRAFTDYWASEIYGEWKGDSGRGLRFDSFEWENRFQLTPQGKYWADVGAMVEAEFPVARGDPNELSLGALLEKQIGRSVTTVNLHVSRQWGPNSAADVDFSYALRSRWLLSPWFEPALEYYGDTGDLRHLPPWSAQGQQAGPGFYGRLPVAPGSALRYSAAVLGGLTTGSPQLTLVGRLEYEFF